MSLYRNILVALDLSKDCELIIEKTRDIANRNDATLNLLHVVEPITFAYGGDVPLDTFSVESQLSSHATERLNALADLLDYPVTEKLITNGSTEAEIKRVAEELGADLVIVGRHDRHGLALLLGSTAKSVMHGADYDVLAIKV